MTGADTDTDTTLATVAGNLYGALMDARPYVRLASLPTSTTFTQDERDQAALHLETLDGALAEAADYLQGE